MSTPFADRIRAKAKEVNKGPATRVGAAPAMAKQAAVSATGKAATPGSGGGQSNIAEGMGAAQNVVATEAVSDQLQDTAEDVGIKERGADVEQQKVDMNLRAQKLEADTQFNDQLKKFESQIKMSSDKKEQDLALYNMKGELQRKRLGNAKRNEALKTAGEKHRLKSREDFAIAMSDQRLARAKKGAKSAQSTLDFQAKRASNTNHKVTMGEVDAALQKSLDDSAAAEEAAKADIFSSAAKMGVDSAMAPDGTFTNKSGPKTKPEIIIDSKPRSQLPTTQSNESLA